MTISTWSPARQEIVAFTFANPGVVTTAQPHGYHDGLYVRISIPGKFSIPYNNTVFLITVLSPTTFSLNADTTNYDNVMASPQVPQVIPIGEIGQTLLNLERNTLTPIGG